MVYPGQHLAKAIFGKGNIRQRQQMVRQKARQIAVKSTQRAPIALLLRQSVYALLIPSLLSLLACGQTAARAEGDQSQPESPKSATEESTLNSDVVVEKPTPGTNLNIEKEGDYSQKLYLEGEKALSERRYETAEAYFKASLKELYRSTNRLHLQELELSMARLDLAMQRNDQAYRALTKLAHGIKVDQHGNVNKSKGALLLSELAEAELRLSRFDEADKHIRQAMRLMQKGYQGLPALKERGIAEGRLARVLSHRGLNQDAKEHFQAAVDLLEQEPGYKQLDLADLLRQEALFYRDIGARKTAAQIFERACAIKASASNSQKTRSLTGEIDYVWEPGSPHSHEIIDQDFPLRYIEVNNTRVAVTVIDLWELAGLLICVTNTDEHRHVFGLGEVKFYKVVKDPSSGVARSYEQIPQVDHSRIDRIRRERNIWDLTQNRPWLANIQKTRNFRGLVPPNGHDLFRGPNVFGVWGEWPGISHVVPTRVAILPSRENVFYVDEAEEEGSRESGLIRSEGIRQMGLLPISMEPLESRTGELFYLYPRNEDVEVRVTVGNTTYSFPFRCRKRRIN